MAPLYDAIYAARGKNYSAEADRIRSVIANRHPRAVTLLDVACGTGEHLRFLRPHFEIAGLDRHPAMVAAARQKLGGVMISEGDMTVFDLHRTFDVVTCLFASVSYLPHAAALAKAIDRMVCHLAPGGLLIIEPPVMPNRLQPPREQTDWFVVDGRRIRRITSAVHRGDALEIRFRFERHADSTPLFTEVHRIALFDQATYEHAFAEAGCTAEFMESSTTLFVAQRHE